LSPRSDSHTCKALAEFLAQRGNPAASH
jgi:hypothetical protein